MSTWARYRAPKLTRIKRRTEKLGENAPETADLYFSYGKALLENAIAQSSVLGKEQGEEVEEDDQPGAKLQSTPRLFAH